MSKDIISYFINTDTFNYSNIQPQQKLAFLPRHSSGINRLILHSVESDVIDSEFSESNENSESHSTFPMNNSIHTHLYSGGRDGMIINQSTNIQLSYHSEWVNDLVSHGGNCK